MKPTQRAAWRFYLYVFIGAQLLGAFECPLLTFAY